MKPLMLDTSVCVAAQRDHEPERALLQSAACLAINPIVAGELHLGVALSSSPALNRRRLAALLGSPRLRVLPIVGETGRYYALIKSQLQRKGRPIPDNDVWIAASAMEHGLALLTYDRHFGHIDGLLLADELLP